MSSSNQWVVGEHDCQRANINNDQGNVVAYVMRRSAGWGGTDEQWRAIIDMIAAAPEMAATLRNLRVHITLLRKVSDNGGVISDEDHRIMLDSIDEALRKAEPPQKQRVLVTVGIDVEVGCEDAPAIGDTKAITDLALLMMRDGVGDIIKSEFVG